MEPTELIEQLAPIVSKNPGHPAFARLGDAYLKNGNVRKAWEILAAGVKANPTYLTGQMILAEVLEKANYVPQAKERYQVVLQIDPWNTSALWALSRIEINQGNEDMASELVKKIIDIDPYDEQAIAEYKSLTGEVVPQQEELQEAVIEESDEVYQADSNILESEEITVPNMNSEQQVSDEDDEDLDELLEMDVDSSNIQQKEETTQNKSATGEEDQEQKGFLGDDTEIFSEYSSGSAAVTQEVEKEQSEIEREMEELDSEIPEDKQAFTEGIDIEDSEIQETQIEENQELIVEESVEAPEPKLSIQATKEEIPESEIESPPEDGFSEDYGNFKIDEDLTSDMEQDRLIEEPEIEEPSKVDGLVSFEGMIGEEQEKEDFIQEKEPKNRESHQEKELSDESMPTFGESEPIFEEKKPEETAQNENPYEQTKAEDKSPEIEVDIEEQPEKVGEQEPEEEKAEEGRPIFAPQENNLEEVLKEEKPLFTEPETEIQPEIVSQDKQEQNDVMSESPGEKATEDEEKKEESESHFKPLEGVGELDIGDLGVGVEIPEEEIEEVKHDYPLTSEVSFDSDGLAAKSDIPHDETLVRQDSTPEKLGEELEMPGFGGDLEDIGESEPEAEESDSVSEISDVPDEQAEPGKKTEPEADSNPETEDQELIPEEDEITDNDHPLSGRLDPKMYSLTYAKIYAQQGNSDKALEIYTTLLSKEKDPQKREEILDLMASLQENFDQSSEE